MTSVVEPPKAAMSAKEARRNATSRVATTTIAAHTGCPCRSAITVPFHPGPRRRRLSPGRWAGHRHQQPGQPDAPWDPLTLAHVPITSSRRKGRCSGRSMLSPELSLNPFHTFMPPAGT